MQPRLSCFEVSVSWISANIHQSPFDSSPVSPEVINLSTADAASDENCNKTHFRFSVCLIGVFSRYDKYIIYSRSWWSDFGNWKCLAFVFRVSRPIFFVWFCLTEYFLGIFRYIIVLEDTFCMITILQFIMFSVFTTVWLGYYTRIIFRQIPTYTLNVRFCWTQFSKFTNNLNVCLTSRVVYHLALWTAQRLLSVYRTTGYYLERSSGLVIQVR